MPAYKRPPVTEAVLEFQLPDEASLGAVERAKSKLATLLPIVIDQRNYHVHLDADRGTVNVSNDQLGYRLSGIGDNNKVVVLKRNAVSASILAPYTGWQDLRGTAETAWAAFAEASAFSGPIARLGLRYINRIDVPARRQDAYEVLDYLRIGHVMPQPPLGPALEFLVMVTTKVGNNDECLARIISTQVESPVPASVGLILDIDVYFPDPVPSESEVLWPLIERMRDYKNELFETCVTDNARELFGRA